MDISQKIENIRQKPEHIRLRYFWTVMFVSMFFMLFLWVFSMKENLSAFKKETSSQPGVTDQIREEFSATQESVGSSFQKSAELMQGE